MPDTPPAAALNARLPLAPRPLLSLRFANRFERPLLLGLTAADGECTLWPVDLDPGSPAAVPPLALDSPFGQPDWDATLSSAGLAAVWSRPGSAISPLWTRAGREAATLFTGQQAQKVFWNPRFVRGAGSTGVTAGALDGPHARLVLLRRRDAPLQALPAIGRGRLRSGLLLRRDGGYWLLALSAPPGAKAPERRDVGGAWLLAGQLAAVALDDQLDPAGPEQAPLGDMPVYEFDADAATGTVGILATTEHGCVATRGRSEAAGWRWQAPQTLAGGPFASPAALADGGGFVVAALQPGATAPQPVWVGRL